MNDQTILLMFCCNNPDNGVNIGMADAFQFDDLIELEGTFVICRHVNDSMLKISHRQFPILSYSTWIGNWCWDGARVTIPVANAIANYLRSLNKFNCIQGEASLYDAWDEKQSIRFETVL